MPTSPVSHLRRTTVTYGLLVALFVVLLQPTAGLSLANGDAVVYSDTLDPAFQNWSFQTTVNLTTSSPTHGGSAHAIAVTYQPGNWGALWLVRPGGNISLAGYTALRFAIHGGSAGGQQIRVQVGTGTNYPTNQVDLTTYLPGGPVAGEWRVVTIPLADLNVAGGFLGSIAFQSAVNSGQATFYLDDLHLLAGTEPPPEPGVSATIRIQTDGNTIPISPYLLGSNLPVWLNPTKLANETFRTYTAAAGIRLLRLPGGSWSNRYGWLSCELGQNQPGAVPCSDWFWAARPSDVIAFLRATGTQGLWVVNPNGTSKEAAALVAFFNGDVNDHRPIGVDVRGTDWRTVSYWAQLRAARGYPEPVGIKLWEFGNEIYGGKPTTGGGLCQPWGWEEVWTCDGTEYVLGKGSGAQRREGYLEFRAAMRAVDPTILVGAVGFENPGDPHNPSWQNYNNWGNKVIAAAGDALDFYAIHPYPYDYPPANNATGYAAILAKPQEHFRTIRTAINAAFDALASGRRAPIAVTEYNLVAMQDQDNAQLMTRAINALFLADSIGQAIQHGYTIFTQWDLANGRASNGTEYGLLHEDNNFYRAPHYYVYPLWARFGTHMLPVTTSLNSASEAAVYAGRVNATTLSLLVINKMARPITATVTADGETIVGGSAYEVRTDSPTAQSVTYNGVANPSATLSEPPRTLQATEGNLTVTFAPWSITLVHAEIEAATGPRLMPASTTLSGRPGEAVSYTLTVTNRGSTATTFTVTVSGNHWPTNVPATIGPLAAGASTTFHVAVTIPDDQTGVHTDTATVTVTAQNDPTKSAQAVVTTIRARFRLFVPLVTVGSSVPR
ncbi:hypothetical protein [uncultured Chloroflexus sp.]|uniref:hypothetical protein n=1 Tax=uncultured Chloroflexus sp. TaxID=214040 RepID=UPI002618B857|nr:hypothetical protein [uncultured Chloroflexus sp.]